MSAMSDYLENKVLDHVLGTSAYTFPSQAYLGLSTGSLGDDAPYMREIGRRNK